MEDGGNVQNDCVGSWMGNAGYGGSSEATLRFSEWPSLVRRMNWKRETQLPIVIAQTLKEGDQIASMQLEEMVQGRKRV